MNRNMNSYEDEQGNRLKCWAENDRGLRREPHKYFNQDLQKEKEERKRRAEKTRGREATKRGRSDKHRSDLVDVRALSFPLLLLRVRMRVPQELGDQHGAAAAAAGLLKLLDRLAVCVCVCMCMRVRGVQLELLLELLLELVLVERVHRKGVSAAQAQRLHAFAFAFAFAHQR